MLDCGVTNGDLRDQDMLIFWLHDASGSLRKSEPARLSIHRQCVLFDNRVKIVRAKKKIPQWITGIGSSEKLLGKWYSEVIAIGDPHRNPIVIFERPTLIPLRGENPHIGVLFVIRVTSPENNLSHHRARIQVE